MGLIYFVLLLGGLIFFHEFGHFIVARLCGVRVLVFSFGFGPRWTLYKSPRSGTEYCLSAFPLGGYVRMLGEDPSEELSEEDFAESFTAQPLWQRTLIVAAGPFFNLILPIFIFFFMGLTTSTLPPSEVGLVMQGGPAWEAGLREGDKIVRIDGEEVAYWWQLNAAISRSANQELAVEYERGGDTRETLITPGLYEEVRIPDINLKESRGQIRVGSEYVKPLVAVREGSLATRAGLKNWDRVIALDGKPCLRWADVVHALTSRKGTVELKVLRMEQWKSQEWVELAAYGKDAVQTVSLVSPGGDDALGVLGLMSSELVVAVVSEGTPAQDIRVCEQTCETTEDCRGGWVCSSRQNRCVPPCESENQCEGQCLDGACELTPLQGFSAASFALEKGDELVALDGRRLQRWHHLKSLVYQNPERLRQLHVRRSNGEQVVGCFVPAQQTYVGEFNNKETRVVFGATNRSELGFAESVANQERLAFALHRALWDTWDALKLNVYAIAGLFVGQVPVEQLGGPIFIGQLAAKTQERGSRWFFGIMVMLSINLGLLNLLPVPMLDGGHLFFFAIEAIQRRPISVRTRQIAAYVGLSFIFLLMVMVFRNDLNRVLGGM